MRPSVTLRKRAGCILPSTRLQWCVLVALALALATVLYLNIVPFSYCYFWCGDKHFPFGWDNF